MFVQVVFGSKEDYYFLEKEEREVCILSCVSVKATMN